MGRKNKHRATEETQEEYFQPHYDEDTGQYYDDAGNWYTKAQDEQGDSHLQLRSIFTPSPPFSEEPSVSSSSLWDEGIGSNSGAGAQFFVPVESTPRVLEVGQSELDGIEQKLDDVHIGKALRNHVPKPLEQCS